jgi:hypothetical protein
MLERKPRESGPGNYVWGFLFAVFGVVIVGGVFDMEILPDLSNLSSIRAGAWVAFVTAAGVFFVCMALWSLKKFFQAHGGSRGRK